MFGKTSVRISAEAMVILTRIFVVLVSPKGKMPLQYLEQATTTSFDIIFISLFTNHPTIPRCISQALIAP
jgi:predicted neutral ceramidase superfamily lipid hydrolase